MRLLVMSINGRCVVAFEVAGKILGYVSVTDGYVDQSVSLVESLLDATAFASESDAVIASSNLPPEEIRKCVNRLIGELSGQLNCQDEELASLTKPISRMGRDELSLGLLMVLVMLLHHSPKWSLIQRTSGVSIVKGFTGALTEAISKHPGKPSADLIGPVLKWFTNYISGLEYFIQLPLESQLIEVVRAMPSLDYWIAEIVAQSVLNGCSQDEKGVLSEGMQNMLDGHLNKAKASLIEGGRTLFPESDFFNAA